MILLLFLGDSNSYSLGHAVAQSFNVEVALNSFYLNNDDQAENDEVFIGWHKHCFTWKSGSTFKVLVNC